LLENLKSGKPLSSWPFPLVLDVILVDLQAIFAKCNQDLISDRDSSLGVTAAQLLHHSRRDLGRERGLRGTAPGRSLVFLVCAMRKRIGINDPDAPFLNAADISVMRFELGSGVKAGIIGGNTRGHVAWLSGRWRQVGRL
jgi:hypothetical protein